MNHVHVCIILLCIGIFISCCIVSVRFRACVKRCLQFKSLDYDALTEIMVFNKYDNLVIECLQARCTFPSARISRLIVDFYPHRDDIVVLRMRVFPEFPVALMFHKVLVGNYGPLCIKQKKAPLITINCCVYQVVEFDFDEEYLLIYLKHE